ncbi:phage tail fiber protein [Klebsiella variicola]|uniref:right-handed parallel beta-helix repeat-containing protein n=1 Tax=Klebsiella pneumoniae complex TaxID=3390273 RepID=UPI001D0D9B9D|nr:MULTISPECIES: right-handed parallel beta-helix repeat-containing protein [Klebsiella]
MTVSTQVSRNEYTGNGATTQYDFTFRILDKSHLLVQTMDTSENIVTLTLGTDYTVTGVNRYNGGKLVLTSALPAGYKISIERSTPVTQEASIRNQGGFFPEIHEDAFDKLTMLVQQAYGWWSGLSLRKPSWLANYYDALNNRIRNLRDPSQAQDAATKSYADGLYDGAISYSDAQFERTLRVPESSVGMIPGVAARKNHILAFNSTGNPITVLPESGSAADVLIDLGSSEEGLGDSLVAHARYNANAESRTVSAILNEKESILGWPADDSDDDSARFTKAVEAGVTAVYIPNPEVLEREIGRPYLLIKDVKITKNLLIFGDGKAGYRQVGGAIRVRDDASYGFFFQGTGNGTDSGVRVIGGGIVGISMLGQTSANTSTFIKTLHASSMEFCNVSFRNGGTAFYLQDFMESRISNCYFNSFGSETADVIHIGDFVDSAPWNVNNLHIENCTYGSNSGHWIYISDSANADLIWIQNNKFEWDSTPTNANSTNKSVIYAGRVERIYVQNNGFVYFYPGHNLYDTIFRLGTAAAYGAVFTNNLAWGCSNSYYWRVNGGSLLARGNRTNTAMAVECTSAHSQDIEEPLIRSTDGNRPTSRSPKRYESNYIPVHYLTGSNASNNFISDSDSTLNETCLQTSLGSEIRRAYIPKDMISSGRVIKVKARIKSTDTADALIQLLCDGVVVNNYTSSLVNQRDYLTVQAGAGWAIVEWYITPAMITSGGKLIIKNYSSTVNFYFDGISIEYANHIDLVIPWQPGVISPNTTVNTAVYMSRLGPYINGVSAPRANGGMGGAIASAYFNGSSSTYNLILQLSLVGATSATPLATTYTVRIFLK